jgi:hypothetical protein
VSLFDRIYAGVFFFFLAAAVLVIGFAAARAARHAWRWARFHWGRLPAGRPLDRDEKAAFARARRDYRRPAHQPAHQQQEDA